MKFKRAVLVILSFIICNSTYSQKMCGTPSVDLKEWRMMMMDMGVNPDEIKSLKPRSTIYITIHYHIVTRSNGTGGYSRFHLYEMHCDLNRKFNENNIDIVFLMDTVSYLNSDEYYTIDNYFEGLLLARTYNTLKHCNVYLVDDPNGACGYTQRPSRRNGPESRSAIYVKASETEFSCTSPDSKTLTHEMGHWLDLPHTFVGWEGREYGTSNVPNASSIENVDRTGDNKNCNTAGDGFCDTDPDYISDRWQCPSNRNYTDPVGETFTHSGVNYMSYSNDECSYEYSQEQAAQMYNCFQTYREREDILEFPAPAHPKIDKISHYSPKTVIGNSKYTTKNFALKFSKIPFAEKYYLTLSVGSLFFDSTYKFSVNNLLLDTILTDTFLELDQGFFSGFNNNRYIYWSIRPINKDYTCNSLPVKIQAFRVRDINMELNVIPPTCIGFENGTIEILDSTGYNGMYRFRVNGLESSGLEIEQLKSGEYIVEVQQNTGDYTAFNVTVGEGVKVEGIVNENSWNDYTVVGTSGKPPFTYFWSDGSEGDNQVLTSGIHTVTIFDDNGCKSDEIEVVVKQSASISQSQEKIRLNIFPTIIDKGNSITVSNLDKGTNRSVQIQIIDIKGSVIRELKSQMINDKIKFNIVEPTGVYIIRLKDNQGKAMSSKIRVR